MPSAQANFEQAARNLEKLKIVLREDMDGGVLDNRYRVVGPNELPESSDVVMARFGLVTTLFVENSQSPEVRRALIEAGQHYVKQVNGHVKLKYNDGKSAYKKVPATGIDGDKIFNSWAMQRGMALHVIEQTENEAEFFNLRMWVPLVYAEADKASYGYIKFSYSLSWVLAQGGNFFADNMTFMCKLLKPVHATAGFGVLVSLDDLIFKDQMEYIYPILRRHPGIEASEPYSLEIFNKMGSVNWLTAIKQEWVDKLGGVEALRSKLQPREHYPILPYDGGCIIQAGLAPAVGDRDKGIILHEYREVAHALKSLRIQPMDHCPQNLSTRYKNMLYQFPGTWKDGSGSIYEKAGEEYLTRFD